MKSFACVFTIATVLTLVGAAPAFAQCSISGVITASPNLDPDMPDWTYVLNVMWDTDVPFALSHLDLLIDPSGGMCECGDVAAALATPDPAGSSDGVGGCLVEYNSILECNGDPSIPGVSGILLKFEPIEEGCEPGPTGVGTFIFYSDLSPVPVDDDLLSLVDKFDGDYCFGNLTGEFPGLACDPIPSADANWGSVKGMFR